VRQQHATRAHTEEMLEALGAPITRDARAVTLRGPFDPPGASVTLPGDPSSAALLALAVAQEGAARFVSLSVSAQRLGFFTALARMGARVAYGSVRDGVCGPEADVLVHGAPLAGLTWSADDVSAVLDEIPALACACALAQGPSRLCGLAALRGKESDRVQSSAALLNACGVGVRIEGDDLLIEGRPAHFPARARVSAAGDHRVAMAALALGRAVGMAITLDDDACVSKSFPGFAAALDAVRAPH
jgi:3-phosphoshikimate 1-carboxyvinyltransferase